ncbi:MAG: VWA domain-containing protein [Bacteroidales bacterium]|jgi:hypothetical protein|nr:VWA domain-containing protein [Bacteroidales bacterium]
MKKIFFKPIFALAALLISGASAVQAQKQQTDSYPKGKYESIYIPEQNFQVGTTIYTANAAKIASDFTSSGYAAKSARNTTSFSSGKYDTPKKLQSPAITLPQVSGAEKLILQLDQAFEVEYKYDFVQVFISTNSSKSTSPTLVYNNTGKTNRISDYADLTQFAGQTITLYFNINADATEFGKGWNLYNISIFTTGQSSTKGGLALRSLNAANVAQIQMLNVKSDDFPKLVTAEFKALDAQGNFVSGLDINDFKYLDNNLNNLSCLHLREVGRIQTPVDVIFMIDNSGSMGSHMSQVKQNVEDLVAALNNKFDLRVGLFRWGIDGGGNPPCPITNYNFEGNPNGSGQDFWYLENKTNYALNDFFNLIWATNTTYGYYEPGWHALSYLANQTIDYRPNAQKVFILLGDESITGDINEYDCNYNLTYQATAIADLQQKGIQVFTITGNDTYSVADYQPIAAATGGMWYNVYSSDYTPIMSSIGQTIADKYILTYCLNTDLEYVEVDSICRPFKIAMKTNPSVNDELCYTPKKLPSITRTPATIALDNVAQPQNQALTVAVEICAPHTAITEVKFRYKQYNASTFTVQTLANGVASGNGCYTYSATIPASAVQNPNVEYLFEAYFADSTMIKSPTPSSSYSSWVITVLPNYPPNISNVTVSPVRDCDPIIICSKIVDNTSSLVKKELHYRIQQTPSVYISIDMTPCPSCGVDVYCATIPREAVDDAGLSYYLFATDNFDSQGWYGSPENPRTLTVSPTPASSSNPMTIQVLTPLITMMCGPAIPGDVLKSYFKNECGNYQVGGVTTVTQGLAIAALQAFGDSNLSDNYKDGFYIGDTIQVRLERNGYEYILESPTWEYAPLIYVGANQSAYMQPMYGSGAPNIQISGNNQVINAGTTITSTTNDTDFGLNNSAATHTFTITNIGCEVLTINGVFPDDTTSFSAYIAQNTVIQPSQSATFTVTYKANATATTYINVINSAAPAKFRFAVTGQKQGQTNSCNMVISPNPMPSYGSNVSFTLNALSTVTAKVYTTTGTLVQTAFGPLQMGAGTHSMYVQPSGLTHGQTYILSIETNVGVCSGSFVVQ